ncbi:MULTISPECIES: hypothetical protein [unclassified Streptomyces]|uniref:hypothetical protein n=1 Tax=unclassified Streptomyces TaxID=2593676 RepID=UPI0011B945FD|nr:MULTISPECIES: hypothetical protein [unclassified Streptomyces]MYT75731.1 hypothetical protein [Streptomyces sp. SID8367]
MSSLSQNAQQRQQQTVEREARLEQGRRDAYLACIETSKGITADWWKLVNCLLSSDRTPELCRQYAETAQHGWVVFTKSADAVCIAGPNAMAAAVQALRESMWTMDRAGTEWYECVRSGGVDRLAACEAAFREAERTRTDQGFVFLAAARRALAAE